jgi:hypothetical protein
MTVPLEVQQEDVERPREGESIGTSMEVASSAGRGVAGPSSNGSPPTQITGATTNDLIMRAIELGTPVEQLDKLMQLVERREALEAARAFADALAQFQLEMPSVKKNKEGKVTTRGGSEYSFTYADLDETVMTARPIAAKFGLSFTWDHVVTPTTLTSLFILRHVAGHKEVTTYVVPTENPSGMSPTQKVGAAQTFADRRSMNSGLGITSSEQEEKVDFEPINDDQAIVINDLIVETKTTPSRFLQFMGVTSVKEILAVDYPRAIAALEDKRKEPKK